jgi:hypothetical protein
VENFSSWMSMKGCINCNKKRKLALFKYILWHINRKRVSHYYRPTNKKDDCRSNNVYIAQKTFSNYWSYRWWTLDNNRFEFYWEIWERICWLVIDRIEDNHNRLMQFLCIVIKKWKERIWFNFSYRNERI